MATDLAIRKAFEKIVRDTIEAFPEEVGIDWPLEKFDDSVRTIYVRPRLGDIARHPRTLGPTPAVHTAGSFSIGCFLKMGERQDRLDRLADTMEAAYPYGLDLTIEGGVVQINRVSKTGLLTPPGWGYRAVDVVFSMEI